MNATLDTWPKVMVHNASQIGGRKAMRYKHYGIWQSYTWQEYFSNVKYLALGLAALGFRPGDKLLIVGDNAPEWYFGELAAQSNRGVSVGLYSDLSAEEIGQIARDSGATFALVEDQEQVDKLTQIRCDLPDLKRVVYWRYKGLSNQHLNDFYGFHQVLDLGREAEKRNPGCFEQNVAGGQADDVCAIVYTSGAEGSRPKGALHSHRTLMQTSEAFVRCDHLNSRDNLVSYLPPAWITEQWLAFGCHLLSGSIVNFPESAETQEQDIREIGPSVVLYSSRLWERQAGRAQARIRGAGALKRLIYRLFMPVGYRLADSRGKKAGPAWHWRLLSVPAYWALFRPLRDSLGLPRARVCYTSGATLCAEAFRFYHALGVPLKNLYGSTEAGAITGASNDRSHPETGWPVNPGAKVRITPGGEIAVQQPGLFLGYHGQPEATGEVLRDGWVLTGDSGRLGPEGNLLFLDRQRDMVTLPCGDVLTPQDIESRLKYSPYVKDGWVVAGPDRSYASAIIIIDIENAGRFADRRKVTYTTFSDLSQKPEIYTLIEQEIDRINRQLPPGCRVRKFVNLPKEFDSDEFELTRNRKMRKPFLAERYDGLVNAIYSGASSTDVETQVKYRDGRTAHIKTSIRIQPVGEDGE